MFGTVRGVLACAVLFLAGCAGPVEAPKSIAEQLEEAGVSSSTAASPTESPSPSPTPPPTPSATPSPAASPTPSPTPSAEPRRSSRRDPSRTALPRATNTAAGAKAFGRYVAQLTLPALAKNDSSQLRKVLDDPRACQSCRALITDARNQKRLGQSQRPVTPLRIRRVQVGPERNGLRKVIVVQDFPARRLVSPDGATVDRFAPYPRSRLQLNVRWERNRWVLVNRYLFT